MISIVVNSRFAKSCRINAFHSCYPCFLQFLFIACLIEALSSGASDTSVTSVYISMNSIKTIYPQFFNLVELNTSSCSASRARHYDTYHYTTEADNMAVYIQSLPLSTVLIGVASYDVQVHLTTNARSALLSIGVDVSGLQPAGKLIFVAPIGQLSATVVQVSAPGGANLIMQVLVRGNRHFCDVFQQQQ